MKGHRRKRSKNIGPQRAVNQRAVRGGRATSRKGRKYAANQKRIKQRAVPALRYVGREGGRDYYATVKKRKR